MNSTSGCWENSNFSSNVGVLTFWITSEERGCGVFEWTQTHNINDQYTYIAPNMLYVVLTKPFLVAGFFEIFQTLSPRV